MVKTTNQFIMNERQNWYIVKQADGTCDIVNTKEKPSNLENWGEFKTQEEAVAKRVGLIRAGKCQPK